MSKPGFVYIMTNKTRTTLYIGVTNNLCRRIYEHKHHMIQNTFTDKYNLEYCIYYEEFPYFHMAIKREKELKKWNRQKKEDLINKMNSEWKVLVTEKGFFVERFLFLNKFLMCFKQIKGSSLTVGMTIRRGRIKGCSIGGCAANASSPMHDQHRHSECNAVE